jgi:hypothetical protein
MITYYPLEDDPPIKKEVPIVSPLSPLPKNVFTEETTECNYIVMAFVIGVLFLALTDSIKR